MNYYNEWDEYPLQWLRNLYVAGHIPAGLFDGRSIVDVQAQDVKPARQAHFFAGIGGWPLALKLAGWPENEEVWTGSCPCQPFSVAGGRRGKKDKRHLWPELFRLIRECLPPVIFGEQVASKDGRNWLSGVRADLESVGYEVGAADLCAAGAGEEGEGWVLRGNTVHPEPVLVGAPHIRQRLFWVADTGIQRRGALQRTVGTNGGQKVKSAGYGNSCRLADGERTGLEGLQEQHAREERATAERGGVSRSMADPQEVGRRQIGADAGGVDIGNEAKRRAPGPAVRCTSCGVDHAAGKRANVPASAIKSGDREDDGLSKSPGSWSRFDVLPCADKRSRRVESGTFPLAHGVPGRVGKLRAYGNAIIPELAAAFIKAYLETSSPR